MPPRFSPGFLKSASTAIRIRTHARIRLLQTQLDQKEYLQASQTLLGRPWESDTMPEMALLAFLSIEAGDHFLANALAEEAREAYRLTPSRSTLIDKQKRKLDELTQTFKARKASVGMGGIMWTDFYEQLIGAATAQLSALQESEDYSEALQLRRARSALLANRAREAWLIFERLSQSDNSEIAEVAHFNWILAAKELHRYPSAIAIARKYLDAYPASESVDEALSLIAHTLIDAGRYQEAIAALSELIKDAVDLEIRTVSVYQRGQCFLRVAEYENARFDFVEVENAATGRELKDKAALWNGISYFLQSDFDKSLEILTSLLKDSQNEEIRGEAHYRYACCLYMKFDYTECVASLVHFEERFEGHPRQQEARLLLGDAYAANHNLEAALEQYMGIPGDIVEIGHLAAIQATQTSRELDRFPDALNLLDTQLELTTDAYKSTEIMLLAVDIHLECGESNRARELLHRIIATNGDSPWADNLLKAIEILASIETIQALPLKDKALGDKQYGLAARYWLHHALSLKEEGRGRQSRESLLALANEIPIEHLPPECLAHVGLELTRLDFELGPKMLERLVSEYSNSYYTPFAYFGFAIKEADNKEYGLALGWLSRMGSEAANLPVFVASMILEGKLRTRVGEYDRSQETLEEALSFRWASSEERAECLLALSDLKHHQDKPEQAIAYCQRVFTLYPGVVDAAANAYFQAARHLAKINESGKAREVLEEFLGRSEYRHTEFFEKAKRLLLGLEKKELS